MEPVIFRLQKAVDFLTPHLELVNSHMVEFFSRNLWGELIPVELRNEFGVESGHLTNTIEYFRKNFCPGDKKLSYFLQECSNAYPINPDDIILDFELLSKKIPNLNIINEEYLLTKNTFMSEKKEHEVILMSTVVKGLSTFTKSTHIIDIGDGRGYLSSHLALQKGLKVLGLDCCEKKTFSAVKRATKMQKHLIHSHQEVNPIRGILKPNGSACDTVNSNIGVPNQLYKQTTAYISSETNLKQFLYESFPNESMYQFGIVGLHTCGSLSPACLKLFVNSGEDTKFLINVGCCYHLLDEGNEIGESSTFPLSEYLKNQKFQLGRNARMLSLQAPDRLYSSEKIPDSLMFRAVFEELLAVKVGHREKSEKEVGRIGSKCKSFEEYCRKGLAKLRLEISVTDSELKNLFEKYLPQKPMLEYYYMLRVSLAPVIEHIILLDRLLYLLENGLPNSYILKLFDPTTSPRCFAILSYKDN